MPHMSLAQFNGAMSLYVASCTDVFFAKGKQYMACRNPLQLDPVSSVQRLFKPADLEMPVDIIGPPDELDASDTEVAFSLISCLNQCKHAQFLTIGIDA